MIDFRGKVSPLENKLVTIGVASYNNSKFLLTTLNSIFNQTYSPIELVVVDDSSSDNSVELVRQWASEKAVSVKLIVNENNMGVCRVCNILLDQLSGYYFVLIGSDDVMEITRLEKQIEYFQELPDSYGLVYSDVKKINEGGEVISESWFSLNEQTPLSGNIFSKFLLDDFRLPSPSIVYKSDVFETVGRYDERLLTEDIDMIMRIISLYDVGYCPITAVRYRISRSSLSQNIGARFYADRILIYSKFLGSNQQFDKVIKGKLGKWAQSTYWHGDPKSHLLLFYTLRIKFNLKSFFLLLCRVMRVSPKFLSAIINSLKNRSN